MTGSAMEGDWAVVKRLSLLRRRPEMSQGEFWEQYATVHGPLAAAQPGFRKFAYQYVQNDIRSVLTSDARWDYDGLSVTWQVPRRDYGRGFFHHPDYANVRPDEERLFDLAVTVSVLATENVVWIGNTTAFKTIVVATEPERPIHALARFSGLSRAVCNVVDRTSAGALGSDPRVLRWDRVWELWWMSAPEMTAAWHDAGFLQSLGLADDGERVRVYEAEERVVYSREPGRLDE